MWFLQYDFMIIELFLYRARAELELCLFENLVTVKINIDLIFAKVKLFELL